MRVIDLGRLAYGPAWAKQQETHAAVVAGDEETIFLVEHEPVVTLGRREESRKNLLRDDAQLAELGIELVHSDRGGDITYHGPGQIVAYPIIRLADHKLSVGGYVHRLEKIVIETLSELGIAATTDPKAVGVWTEGGKICAIGVRIRRGVTMHGLALNVTTELAGFSHIIPCGLEGRSVTSISKILGENVRTFEGVKGILTRYLVAAFDNHTRSPSSGTPGKGGGGGSSAEVD